MNIINLSRGGSQSPLRNALKTPLNYELFGCTGVSQKLIGNKENRSAHSATASDSDRKGNVMDKSKGTKKYTTLRKLIRILTIVFLLVEVFVIYIFPSSRFVVQLDGKQQEYENAKDTMVMVMAMDHEASMTMIMGNKNKETGDNNDDDHHVPIYAPPDEKVLGLLFPPGIYGGYRNQIMRLIGFVTHALSQNIHYILLDSLIAVTRLPENSYVPFEFLFDVDHWNSFKDQLPMLVDYHESSNYTCWQKGMVVVVPPQNVIMSTNNKNKTNAGDEIADKNQSILQVDRSRQEVIKRGFFTPVFNRSKALISGEELFDMGKLRRLDLSEEAKKCEGNPIPYGGGKWAGHLWNQYLRMAQRARHEGSFPFHAQEFVLRALIPKKKWRDLSMSCVSSSQNYLGLHVRMEPDMIGHACGKTMEHNATRLFHHITHFLSLHNDNHSNISIDTISIATSRKDMEIKTGRRYHQFKTIMDENLSTLNHYTKSNEIHIWGGRQVSIFECGEELVKQYLKQHPEENAINYGSVLPMMINFHMLTEAKIFIGVRKSSYSTDVWTTRYYQGKGKYNYEYTPEGILPIENDGLPLVHTAC